jgi:hypothetical protein
MHHYVALLMQISRRSMKAITLRNLPPDLVKAVRREAERKRTSINKAVISLLESKADIQKKKKVRKPQHQELDALAGSWSKKEAAEFDEALAAQRSIDPDLWK